MVAIKVNFSSTSSLFCSENTALIFADTRSQEDFQHVYTVWKAKIDFFKSYTVLKLPTRLPYTGYVVPFRPTLTYQGF